MAVVPLIPLSKVASALSVPDQDILSAFVLGSRLWGTSNAQSDYDTYLILKKNASLATTLDKQKGFISVHSGNIDGIIMTETTYKGALDPSIGSHGLANILLTFLRLAERLKECAVFDLVTLWLPPEFVMKSTLNIPWKLDLDALVASVQKVAARDVAMAEKQASNGNYDKTKKVLVHVTRMIMMATEIVDTDRVENWECASNLFNELRDSYHLTSWDAFVQEVLPQKEEAMTRFLDAVARRRAA